MSKRTHEAMANGNGNGHAEAEMTTISEYLLTRLEQVGVSHAFGVPGDFFLRFLDYVEDHPTIEWVGCTNELNASYAADGYARMKRGLGVLVTTFGVGELSATNGIAGSFSEHVPVLHIVGVPSTGLQSKGALLHHTLGDGRFDAFQNIYSNITVTQAHIQPASRKFGTSTAGEEIDRAIFQALKTNRPTYLTLPTDLVDALIPAEPLRTSVTHSSIDRLLSEPGVSAEVEQHIIAKICKMYERAQRPCVLVDAGVVRFHMQDATKELIEKTGMTFFSSPMGKAAMDENSAQFGGNYVGSITMPGVKEAFENADFVLSLGSLKTDFNSAGFTYRMDTANTVELHNDHTMIQYATYPNAGYRSLLPKLIPAMAAIKKSPDQVVPRMERGGLIQHSAASGATPNGSHMITQDEFWPLWASHFKNGDVVISEIGSASFGLLDVAFPTGAEMQAQILWGSIGWATAATLGAGLVARQQGRRTILFTGDGSIQLTVQEISTMIRQGLKPIIVVLNNDGYTVERIIHGAEKKYNDIQPWNWQQVLGLFSPQEQAGSHASHKTTTRRELEDLLNGPLLQDDSKIHLVEVILGRLDAPRALSAQAKMVTKANKPEEKAH